MIVTNNHYDVDVEVDSSIDGSIDNSIVESSISETIVVDPAPLVAESEPEFDLNQFFDDDD
jgi:hypothetical protein